MSNTYKMSWARAITEFLITNTETEIIRLEQLAPLVFKYYWNQTIFFDLKQGPLTATPVIYQIVKGEISKRQYAYPVMFTPKVQDEVNIPINKICKELARYVCKAFLILDKQSLNIYDYSEETRTINVAHPEIWTKYSAVLLELINYRWVRELEKYNSSPRISQKVRGTDQGKIKRGSLAKFKKYLYEENRKRICFISGEVIREGQESIDHVIPWSYLYSDDLWNLVLVSKRANSSKSNRRPSEEMIQRLEE